MRTRSVRTVRFDSVSTTRFGWHHWDGLIGMPSRLTAPDSERAERSSALGQAKRLDAVQNYRGIRISRKGRRFMINKARIWTLWDAEERICGQAACFSDWWWL